MSVGFLVESWVVRVVAIKGKGSVVLEFFKFDLAGFSLEFRQWLSFELFASGQWKEGHVGASVS
jgi:hypothetical protein